MKLLFKFVNDTSGATQIEYAVIGALISVAVISSIGMVGNGVTNMYGYLANKAVPALK